MNENTVKSIELFSKNFKKVSIGEGLRMDIKHSKNMNKLSDALTKIATQYKEETGKDICTIDEFASMHSDNDFRKIKELLLIKTL